MRPQYTASSSVITGLPRVREKSGKTYFFQGQGNVREFWNLSGKFLNMQMSGKCQGILWHKSRGSLKLLIGSTWSDYLLNDHLGKRLKFDSYQNILYTIHDNWFWTWMITTLYQNMSTLLIIALQIICLFSLTVSLVCNSEAMFRTRCVCLGVHQVLGKSLRLLYVSVQLV